MCAVQTKHISGDVSVGRHTTIGGNARVKGAATIDHDLIVNGWLDARNVRGANKGLFATLDALEQAYPQPQAGWCALVGDTLPAPLYVAAGGAWHPTGRTAGEMTIDLRTYQAAVAELQNTVRIHDDDIDELSVTLNGNGSGNNGALYELNQIAQLVGYKPGTTLSGWKNLINAADNYWALCQTLRGSSPDSEDYGRPGTFVTLGDDGRINSDFILSRGVMVFDGFETPPAGSIKTGSDTRKFVGHVVYDESEPTFYLKDTENGVTSYYKFWKGWEMFKDQDEIPLSDRLYLLDGTDNRGEIYAFDPGSDAFFRVGFTKDELAKLLEAEQNVGYLQSRVARHEERMADIDTTLSQQGQSIMTLKHKLALPDEFIADWLEAGETRGAYDKRQYTGYDEATGTLTLYGEPVTYAEAREAMRLKAITDHEMLWEKGLEFSLAKHILPLRVTNHNGNAGRCADFQFSAMTVIAFDIQPYGSVPASGYGLRFRGDVKQILYLKVNSSTTFTSDCFVCPNLEKLELIGLTKSLDLQYCSKLSLESLMLIVDKAANTEPITITLHAEAFARLTDELTAAATAKQITFTTA